MRIILTILFANLVLSAMAQEPIIKYYDEQWNHCPKENATYYASFVEEGDLFKVNSYWADSDIIRGKSYFSDTVMQLPRGKQVLYFRNGDIQDSSRYTSDGRTIERWIYHNNRKLFLHYLRSDAQSHDLTEAYDSNGKRITPYIYEKEAEFKGGTKAWVKYLTKNTTKSFEQPNAEASLNVQVVVEFEVDKSGFVKAVKVRKSSGMPAVDRDAVAVIAASPQWEHAIQNNYPVNAYRLAPLTYELLPAKKGKY